MRSLRFRIPAIFLVGVLVAGVVTAVFAIRLFQDYTQDRAVAEIRRQAAGLAQLYEDSLLGPDEEGRMPGFAASVLEDATGSRIYYSGIEIVPAGGAGVRPLARSFINWEAVRSNQVQTFEFVPPDSDLTFIAHGEDVRGVAGWKLPDGSLGDGAAPGITYWSQVWADG